MRDKIVVVFLMLVFLNFILLSGVSALTASIGNAKMILYPEVGFFGTTIEKTILAKNVNNESVNVTLTASEEFKDMVKILDANFILQPGEEKNALFKIKIKKEGDYAGKILVSFNSLEDKKTSVALASNIIIHARKNQNNETIEENEEEEIDEEEAENSEEENATEIGNSGKIGNENRRLVMLLLLIPTILLVVILIFLLRKINNKKKKRSDRSS